MNKLNATVLAVALLLFIIGIIICACSSGPVQQESSEVTEDSSLESTVSEESSTTEEQEESMEEQEEPTLIVPVSSTYVVLESEYTKELAAELRYCEEQYTLATTALESLISLDYDTELITALREDCHVYSYYIEYYKELIVEINEQKFANQSAEYPAATYVWYYLKEQGWSDIVCAGIMGNLMQEVGGRTLNLDYLHSNDYYGICCWKKVYHPEVVDADLEGQCAYLVKTLVGSMNNSGYLYREGYDFEAFLAAETLYESANAFMIVYERPGHTESPKRYENSIKAYEYFVGPYVIEED